MKDQSADFPPETPLIVAEIGGNHGGDPALAREMIAAAAAAGAGAVKFQAYRPESLLTRDSAYFDELAAEALDYDDLARLADEARARGVLFLASVFDAEGLDLLRRVDAPAVKIASGDLTHGPLLAAAAESGRPVLLSTGAADETDIQAALDVLGAAGAREVILLHCTALYPAPDHAINLMSIPFLAMRFGRAVGFSDHSLGVEIPLAAVALGAVIVEKHFTTSRRLPGGDNAMSLEPPELAALCAGARRVARARGTLGRPMSPEEAAMRGPIRRSLVAARPIAAGEVLTADALAAKRPGHGLSPLAADRVVGRRAVRPIPADHPIDEQDLT